MPFAAFHISDHNKKRVDNILEVVMAYARLDFSKKNKRKSLTTYVLSPNKYYPTMGSFKISENAHTEVAKNIRNGLSCFVGKCPNSNYYLVILSTEGFDSRIEVENAFKKYKEQEYFGVFKCGK